MPTTTDKEFKGSAVSTVTTSSINSSDLTVSISDPTGWPTGAQPFGVVIGKGTATEEKVLCSARVGTTLTISSRGVDNTTAASHTSGSTIEHCLFAADLDALFRHATDTSIDDHTQYLKTTTAASTYLTSTTAASTYLTQANAASTYAPLTKLPTITSASVATSQSTTSTSYTDLSTSGPAVTVTVPSSGVVKVTLTASLLAGTNDYAQMGFAMSGANTASAGASNRVLIVGNSGTPQMQSSATYHITGLNSGSTTFTAKYTGAFGASATFANRQIIVETYP